MRSSTATTSNAARRRRWAQPGVTRGVAAAGGHLRRRSSSTYRTLLIRRRRRSWHLAAWRSQRGHILMMLGALSAALVVATGADAEGVRIGQRPPAFNVADLSGQPQTVAQYAGRILVLHFWATWCPYCRGEIPKLVTVHQEFGLKGVSILAVSVDQDVAQLRRFVEQVGLPYAVVADAELPDSLTSRYRVPGVPVTYLIGRDGRIAARLVGSSDLVGIVRRALDGSPAAGSS